MKKILYSIIIIAAVIWLLPYVRSISNTPVPSVTQYTQSKENRKKTNAPKNRKQENQKQRQQATNHSTTQDGSITITWTGANKNTLSSDDMLSQAFQNKAKKLQVNGSGVVTQILPDDQDGAQHQRFILTLNSGQTVLIAHNVDLAERIESLKTGDIVSFYGQYEWNGQGGIIHWTHKDPYNKRIAGWLKHNGKIYQ